MIVISILLISMILGLVIGAVRGRNILGRVGLSILGVLSGTVIGMFLTVITSGILTLIYEVEYEHASSQELYALEDNLGTSGGFFLGSGNVDSQMKYYYMVEEEMGLKMKSVLTDEVYVREIDSESASIDYYNQKFKSDKLNNLIFPFGDGKRVIHIPKGSVIQNYNIDLQ